jgi:DNA-binding LytR/AlgR family response regulator
MKILIIEDEKPAYQKIERLLRNIDERIEVTCILESVEDATNWLSVNSHPDLILMDVQLEDGLCFEIFEKIELKVPVIFITAYDQYAIKAFKVNSVDYLLKPVNESELRNAIQKYKSVYENDHYSKVEALIKQLQPAVKERFLIKVGEHFKSILATDIRCFYIRERCVFLFTEAGKSYPVDYSLEKIEEVIDSRIFFRVNRNFIVKYSCIKDIISYSSSRLKIVLDGWTEDEIIVSRERVSDFKAWIDR